MSEKLTSYKIFIASPGGLREEREKFKNTISEFNQDEAIVRGIYFHPVRWEEALGGTGRPQAKINEELKACDFFILILHNRWGSPSSRDEEYSSGTEEEFHLALKCLNEKEKPMQEMVLFFKDVDNDQLIDPGDQLKKVLTFRKEREKEKDFFFHSYDTSDKFQKDFRRYLSEWLRKIEADIQMKKTNEYKVTLTSEYNEKDYEWLKLIMKYDDWKLASETAEKYVTQGKTLEAEVIFNQIENRSYEPILIAKYGKYLRRQGRLNHAEAIIEKALVIAKEQGGVEAIGYCLRQHGRIKEFMGNTVLALDKFNEALKYFKLTEDKSNIARTYRDIGFALNKNGKPYEALMSLKKSRSIYKSIENMMGVSACQGCMGSVFKDIGNLKEAEKHHMNALLIQTNLPDSYLKTEALAKIKSNLGVVKRLQGLFDEAKGYHLSATKHFKVTHNERGLSKEYSNLGVVNRGLKNYNEALRLHSLSLELETKNGFERGICIQLSCIGLIKVEQNQFEQAEIYFNDSLKLSKKLNNIRGVCHQYRHLSEMYVKMKALEKATKNVCLALEIDSEFENEFGIAVCEKVIAEIDLIKNINIQKSKELLLKSKETLLKLGVIIRVKEINNLLIKYNLE